MKKFIAVTVIVIMALASIFCFAGCNKAEANSELLTQAVDKLVTSDALHFTITDTSIKFKSEAIGADSSIDVNGDVYVRKADSGYDLAVVLNVLMSDYYEDDDMTALDATQIQFYLSGNKAYTFERNVSQYVVNGVGYKDYGAALAGTDKDASVISGIITDWSGVDKMLGNTGEESRVDEDIDLEYVNTLDSALANLVEETPIMKQLKLDSADNFVALIQRALESAKKIEGGETKKAKDDTYTVTVDFNIADKISDAVTAVKNNMDNKLGVALDAILNKDSGYAESVVDELFPATGNALNVNQFIAKVEEILAENGIDLSVKEIVDELQTILGLSTQELADIITPYIKEMAGVSVSLSPKDGETLYDTLSRTAFEILNVDTILGLIGEGDMNSQAVNAMLKGMMSGEDAMTLRDVFSKVFGEMTTIVDDLAINAADIQLDFKLDKSKTLTNLGISCVADIASSMPTGSGDATEAINLINLDVKGSVAIEYTVDEAAFAVPAEITSAIVEIDASDKLSFVVNQTQNVSDILKSLGQECKGYASTYSLYSLHDNGYVEDVVCNMSHGYSICFTDLPEEGINTIIIEVQEDDSCWFISIPAANVKAA